MSELILGRDIVIDTEETEADVRFKQLIANVQREDLGDIDLGQAFVTLKEEYGYQYNEIAEILGRTPHFVAAKVGLIKRLDPRVRQLYLEDAGISRGTGEDADVQGNDGGSGECILNTFSSGGPAMAGRSRRPHQMNINILEDVARLPWETQSAAYQVIMAQQLDKDQAIEYLRSMKKGRANAARAAQGPAIALMAPTRSGHAENVRKQIGRVERDMECLAGILKTGGVDPEVDAEIESLIGQLSALCEKLNARYTAGRERAGPDSARTCDT